MRILFLFLLACFSLRCEEEALDSSSDAAELAPLSISLVENSPSPPMEKAYAPRIRGVFLRGRNSPSHVPGKMTNIHGVWFSGIDAPGGNENLAQALLPLFCDRLLTQNVINDLKKGVALYFQRHNYPFVKVIVPKQGFSQGIIQMILIESSLGKTRVLGNRHTSSQSIEKWIRLKPGESINELTALRDIGWMNTNPFRKVNLVYRPGEQSFTTDVDFVVSDRKTWRTYIGADNTGTPLIGRTRWLTGLNASNIFFPDHSLSFQFTAATYFPNFKSYTFQYSAPLPWRDTFSFFGAYATTNPRVDLFTSHGKTYQLSARYADPYWFSRNAWIDQITWECGFDYKGTNNNIIFGEDNGTPISQQLVWIGQFAGSAYVNYDRHGAILVGGAELYWSPGPMLPHQTDADFDSLREGATPHYFYARFVGSWEQALLKGMNIYSIFRAQVADAPLLGSEQFALGGYNTVRGYDERVVNGDNAVNGNFEFRLPIFPLIGQWTRKVKDQLHFLLFCDGGYAWDNQAISGLPIAQSLLSVGGGLRYHLESYGYARLDLGFPLIKVVSDDGNPRVHFSTILSY